MLSFPMQGRTQLNSKKQFCYTVSFSRRHTRPFTLPLGTYSLIVMSKRLSDAKAYIFKNINKVFGFS